MSAQQSDLSSASFGYDIVLATTQRSMNIALQNYLGNIGGPAAIFCYVADAQGAPVSIAYDALVALAHGSDPFAIPDGVDPDSNTDVQNLAGARFMAAFRVRMGLPPGVTPLPDIVTFGNDTGSVQFNMLCSQFDAVQYQPKDDYSPASWRNCSQPSGDAWIFGAMADMRLQGVGQSGLSQLPMAVQQQINQLDGNPFSVAQLLFDLSRATLNTIPTISGVQPHSPILNCLNTYFVSIYSGLMAECGQPPLSYSIMTGNAAAGALTPTELNFQVCPYIGSPMPGLATLNYLCATANLPLPPAAQFNWNWIDAADQRNFDGVVAINRNTLARYLHSQLLSHVMQNCYLSWVRVWLSGFFDSNCHWDWNLTAGQAPVVTYPATGATVLSYAYQSNAEDSAGDGGDMGQMRLTPNYTVDVAFAGNAITITQHLCIYLRVQSMQTSDGGNVVDKTIVDTYTFNCTNDGALCVKHGVSQQDNSQVPSVNGFLNFFSGINDIINDAASWAQNLSATNLDSLPLSICQQIFFPGGDVFAYQEASFSDDQDLVAYLTYLNPVVIPF